MDLSDLVEPGERAAFRRHVEALKACRPVPGCLLCDGTGLMVFEEPVRRTFTQFVRRRRPEVIGVVEMCGCVTSQWDLIPEPE